jgi:Domain of unknown function (DUF5916)/Carbohydrate family 9 binding domain-like
VQLVLLVLMLGSGGPSKNDIDYETAHLERRIEAVKISEKIIIDGKLDEAAWANASVAKDFVQSEPREGEPSIELSEVRVLYDGQSIYFGAYLHDSKIKNVVVADLKKDFQGEAGDSFDVVLDTFHDERNGYIFSTNAAGAKFDSQMINEGRENNNNWDGVWYVKTGEVDDGWIAEIAIPFRTFKFRESDVQTWGINFHRNLRSAHRNEDSFWSPIPRIYNLNRVSLAGTLEGLEGIKPGSNIRFKPYVTSSYAQNKRTGVNKTDSDVGFDAKYGLTSGLTLDFTYNTDFSQVEADEQQINLTRFSLFFPEKREFFLENSGIFKFGSNRSFEGGGGGINSRLNSPPDDVFFFSRTIGLSSSNEAVPILGGTRLTGRTGPFEIGVLNVQQRGYMDSEATNFTVGRLKRNILANSDIGVMVMDKEVANSLNFNRIVGTDANLRFGQYTTVNAFVAKASLPGVTSDNMEGNLAFNYQDRRWHASSGYTFIQNDFINEMGYTPRRGIRKYESVFGRYFRPQNSAIRLFQPHMELDYFEDEQGHLDSKYVSFHFPITWQNGAQIQMGKNATVEALKKSFTLNNGKNNVPAGIYDDPEYFFFYRPDQSRRLAPSFRWGIGPFYTGYKHTYTFAQAVRVSNKFNGSVNFTHNNISLADGHYKTNLVSTRLNYSFSTSMFLNALVQYNSDARQWSSNIRFNIIHRPLSDFFLVYNERRNSLTGDLQDRAIIAKLTYMIQR